MTDQLLIPCSVEGCNRKVYAKTLCNMHYQRQRNAGSTDEPKRNKVPQGAKGTVLLRDEFGRKRCYYCDAYRDVSEFNKDRRRMDGLALICRSCRRDQHVQYRYGMTAKQLDQKLAEQGNRCAICKAPDLLAGDWVVDHNHKCCPGQMSCGKCVRAILCRQCNAGIGMFNDSPEAIEAAAKYLRKWVDSWLKSPRKTTT
jgi:hypothetical protein